MYSSPNKRKYRNNLRKLYNKRLYAKSEKKTIYFLYRTYYQIEHKIIKKRSLTVTKYYFLIKSVNLRTLWTQFKTINSK